MSALPPHVQPIAPVDLAKCCRVLNHGPTVLVSARHGEAVDVMAAAWACVLDFTPPKMSVVLDKSTRTRALIEQSGRFVLQVPTVAQLALTQRVGTTSLHDMPHKLQHAGVQWLPDLSAPFAGDVGRDAGGDAGVQAHICAEGEGVGAGTGMGQPLPKGVAAQPACPDAPAWPLVAGCSAWLACRLIPEPHNQQTYDLFIGQVQAAWADARVFRQGRWHFEQADPQLRSLHHVAGGHFYAVGEAMRAG